MKPASCLQAGLEILEELFSTPAPLDLLLKQYFLRRRYIGSKDRKEIRDLIYNILRTWGVLTYKVSKADSPLSMRHYLLAYLYCIQGQSKKDIQETLFTSALYAPPSLTPQEKNFLELLKESDEELLPLWAQYNVPEWLWPYFLESFGGTLSEELEALNQKAPLDIRINLLKTSRQKVLEHFHSKGQEALETPYSKEGLRFLTSVSLQHDDLAQKGAFEIQDEGSQIISLLCDVDEASLVCDFCAGAGGKTLALSTYMKNKGRILALDISERRLLNAQQRALKAKTKNIEFYPLSSLEDSFLKTTQGQFDRVLVDAPCSGTGTGRRNPEQRWKLTAEILEELLLLQRKILKVASTLVRPGGRFIYATCSLLERENESQIMSFLKENPSFTPLPLQPIWSKYFDLPYPASYHNKDFIRLSPSSTQTDGFFAAILEKK
jgi:16S rRNA (cytosine967-C5)-methyltransferase